MKRPAKVAKAKVARSGQTKKAVFALVKDAGGHEGRGEQAGEGGFVNFKEGTEGDARHQSPEWPAGRKAVDAGGETCRHGLGGH